MLDMLSKIGMLGCRTANAPMKALVGQGCMSVSLSTKFNSVKGRNVDSQVPKKALDRRLIFRC